MWWLLPLSSYKCIYVFNNSDSYEYKKNMNHSNRLYKHLFKSIIMKGWIVKVKRAYVLFWRQAVCKQRDTSADKLTNWFDFKWIFLCLILIQKKWQCFKMSKQIKIIIILIAQLLQLKLNGNDRFSFILNYFVVLFPYSS